MLLLIIAMTNCDVGRRGIIINNRYDYLRCRGVIINNRYDYLRCRGVIINNHYD